MNILKTPRQKMLEEAGAVPSSPGMLKTPQQLLLEESGAMPNVYADGGQVQMSPEDMLATLVALGYTPQRFAKGGLSTTANIGSQAAVNASMLTPEMTEFRKNLQAKKYGPATENLAALGLALSPLNPITALLSLMSPSQLGDATLDTYYKQKSEEEAKRQELARMRARTYSPVFLHNQPVPAIDFEQEPSFPSTSRFMNK